VANRRPSRAAGEPAPPRPPEHPGDPVVFDPEVAGELADAVVTEVTDGDLDDVELVRCVLEGVRLTARSARRLRLVDVVLRDCELSGADLSEARLTRVRLEGCRAEGLDLGMVKGVDLVVVGSKFTEASARMAELERWRLDDCDLRRSEWQRSVLTAGVVDGCDLDHADLSGARLSEVRLVRTRLDDVVGARALAGATVDSSQLVPLALAVFADLGIRLDGGADDDER
jgi:uncharacterized protein YjbI with pentapeptide repeats